jgi:guanylate kinase
VSGPDFPVVVSAPSGAGKSTIEKELRRRRDDVLFSISATTRRPRPGEVDGVNYHFVGVDEFRRMIAAGELIEWAEVHGNYYGTPLAMISQARREGKRLLLDIDVQGARQVRERVPDAVLVFILPPSGAALAERLSKRGTEKPEVLRRRLANARDEVRVAGEFDHVIVNDLLDQAVGELDLVFRGEAGRIRPVERLEDAIERICAEIDEHLARMGGEVSRHAS